jgi:gluconolactonase
MAAREHSSTTTRKRLNSPNDVIKSNGDIYFMIHPMDSQGPDDPSRELDFCGVYRLTPNGELTLLVRSRAAERSRLSPDEDSYVAQSDQEGDLDGIQRQG